MKQGFIVCFALMNSIIVIALSTQTVKRPAEVCQFLGLKSRITVLVLEVGKEMWELEELVHI